MSAKPLTTKQNDLLVTFLDWLEEVHAVEIRAATSGLLAGFERSEHYADYCEAK